VRIRELSRNALVYAVGSVGLRAGSFFLIPLYTHALSMDDWARLAILLITSQILVTVTNLGMVTAMIRFTTEYERDKSLGVLVGSSTCLILAVSAVATLFTVTVLNPLFRSILHADHASSYLWLTCSAAAAQALFAQVLSFYRAKSQPFRYLFACMTAFAVLIALTLTLVLAFHQGVRAVLFAQTFTYGGASVLLGGAIAARTGFYVTKRACWQLFCFGSPLIVSTTGDTVTIAAIQFFLSRLAGLEQVAIYALGAKLAQIIVISFIAPFQQAYEPLVYSNIGESDTAKTISKLFTYFTLGFAYAAFGIQFVSRPLLDVIAPPEYASAFTVLLLLLPGMAFRGLYTFGNSLLYIRKRTWVSAIVIFIMTLVSVALCLLAIPAWHMYGAVLVFDLTMACTAIALVSLGMRTMYIRIERRIVVPVILFVSLLALDFYCSSMSIPLYYTICPLAGLATVAALFLFGFFDANETLQMRTGWQRVQKALRP